MLEKQSITIPSGIRATINDAYRMDELTLIKELCQQATLSDLQCSRIYTTAKKLVEAVRSERKKSTE